MRGVAGDHITGEAFANARLSNMREGPEKHAVVHSFADRCDLFEEPDPLESLIQEWEIPLDFLDADNNLKICLADRA